MSIYVKAQRGATPLQTPQFRCMKLGTSQDTLERADNASTIIRSVTVRIDDIPVGVSFHPTGLPKPTQPNDFWIDAANSFLINHSRNLSYPIGYINPKSWEDSMCCHLENMGETLVVVTGSSSWSQYSFIATIKYTDAIVFKG